MGAMTETKKNPRSILKNRVSYLFHNNHYVRCGIKLSGFYCISLMIINGEHLFMYLLAICEYENTNLNWHPNPYAHAHCNIIHKSQHRGQLKCLLMEDLIKL